MMSSNIISKIINKFFLNDPRRDAKKMILIHDTVNCGKAAGISLLLKKIQYSKLTRRYNCHIPFGASIGDDVFFPHGTSGVFISSGAIIGKSAVIFQQVTIGSNTLLDSNGGGTPVLGDNVYIGVGAKIIGGVRVGNNVRIGANAVVTVDIPDNSTVVLEHPRVIRHSEIRNNAFMGLKEYSVMSGTKDINICEGDPT